MVEPSQSWNRQAEAKSQDAVGQYRLMTFILLSSYQSTLA